MPRYRSPNLRLTPIERELLWMLEEAGEENLLSVFNALRSKFPETTDDTLIRETIEAIQHLLAVGFISIESPNGFLRIGIEERAVREVLAKYEEIWVEIALGMWRRHTGEFAPYPESLVLTDAGRQALTT